ncbi:MAG: hypothetical protein NTU48_04630 [Legionellales bacterium]|nr:hypothetical protein [Legionellales bacterium]
MHDRSLEETLQHHFPINIEQASSNFRFFAVCNEFDVNSVIESLAAELATMPAKTDQRKVALLFGESHFLSLMPILSQFVDVIILADIEIKLHVHNQHLLSTFIKSENISQFLKNYCQDFPEIPFSPTDIPSKRTIHQNVDRLLGKMSRAFASLGAHHFLSNSYQYQQCKQAYEKLSIVQIQLNLVDINACHHLACILSNHEAQIAFCNFTNIYQFVDIAILRSVTTQLLQYSKPDFILYSIGSSYRLNAQYTRNIEGYFAMANRFHTQSSSIYALHPRPAKYSFWQASVEEPETHDRWQCHIS